ncbi:hypothetical protein [Nonomuraea jabiensis]|uniref:Uncharacterized protein n=1 Tax=Nonomuraea jabiensis TaxID=882448 RepID=A0A7W9GJY1_9ACTN|nr:hypothetical protein [Nonomuraea jabiensis]MBB5785252.1 hypothetical protein [Nonomuraea jabiensis]
MLRKAGRREFSERHDGFVVEAGGDGAPFLVACTDEAGGSAPELARYRVEPDPGDDQVLLVREGS